MGGSFYLEPVDANFDFMLLHRYFVPLVFEASWVFVAGVQIPPGDIRVPTPWRLLECKISRVGVLRRNYSFRRLQAKDTSDFSNDLTRTLEHDERLMKCLKIVNPEALSIRLLNSLGPKESIDANISNLDVLKIKPGNVLWLVSLERSLSRGLLFSSRKYAEIAVSIYETIDRISGLLRDTLAAK